MTPVERLIATARAEVGYLEKASCDQLDDKTANAGKNNWTKYARDLDGFGTIYNGRKNGYNWCDIWTDWVFIQTFGVELGMKLLCQCYEGLGAGVKWSAMYYQQAGRFHEENPKPGDQIFFGAGSSWWHTGIVVDVREGRVYTIEGNTTSASGVIPNGGCVAEKSYSLTYANIKGYGRPDWSLVEEDDDMDLEKFKALWHEMRQELQDNDCSDWSEEARRWALETGLVAGGSDSDFSGMWEDQLTREQAVVLFYRFAKMVGLV